MECSRYVCDFDRFLNDEPEVQVESEAPVNHDDESELVTDNHKSVATSNTVEVSESKEDTIAPVMQESASTMTPQQSFESRLTTLERMIALQRKMGDSFSGALEELIEKQVEMIIDHLPAWPFSKNGISESYILTYASRFAEIRERMLAQRYPSRDEGWDTGAVNLSTYIDGLLKDFIRMMDVRVIVNPMVRALDPLAVMEGLKDIDSKLVTKHHLGQFIEDVFLQNITAMSFAQAAAPKPRREETTASTSELASNPRTQSSFEIYVRDEKIRELSCGAVESQKKLDDAQEMQKALMTEVANLKTQIAELASASRASDAQRDERMFAPPVHPSLSEFSCGSYKPSSEYAGSNIPVSAGSVTPNGYRHAALATYVFRVFQSALRLLAAEIPQLLAKDQPINTSAVS